MTDQVATDGITIEKVPTISGTLRVPQIIVYSHSALFYWWPAWFFGFAIALFQEADNRFFGSARDQQISFELGLSYLCLLLLLIVMTNVRLRGIYSVAVLLALGFIAVLLAWLGLWDDIARLIPYLRVQMNSGFYLVFSAALLLSWAIMFFIFDRLTYWRIRPGQLTIEHRIGGGAESFDTNALQFRKLNSDLFRAVFGFGAGEMEATGPGQPGEPLRLPNVLFANRKVKAIERLIAVKPDLVD
jgi:hypothetical protein